MNLYQLQLAADKAVILSAWEDISRRSRVKWVEGLVRELDHKGLVNMIKTMYPENKPLREEDYQILLNAMEILE